MEKMSPNTNALNWFEIPALDMARATSFYETIFEIKLEPVVMMNMEMAMFPIAPPKVGGALVKSEMHIPGPGGCLVYLNANPDVQRVLDRVEAAGGSIVMPKTFIDSDTGYMAFLKDCEGNTIGLHSGA